MQMLESKALIQSMAQILIGFNLIGFNLILTKECEFAAQQINWHSDVRLNLPRLDVIIAQTIWVLTTIAQALSTFELYS